MNEYREWPWVLRKIGTIFTNKKKNIQNLINMFRCQEDVNKNSFNFLAFSHFEFNTAIVLHFYFLCSRMWNFITSGNNYCNSSVIEINDLWKMEKFLNFLLWREMRNKAKLNLQLTKLKVEDAANIRSVLINFWR